MQLMVSGEKKSSFLGFAQPNLLGMQFYALIFVIQIYEQVNK